MFGNVKALTLVIIGCAVLFGACSGKDSNMPDIQFAGDTSAIVITQIDAPGYLELERRSKAGDSLTYVISVLESPGEDDSLSMEREFPGKIEVKDQKLIFQPAEPFVKGKQYIVSTILNTGFGSKAEMLKDGLNARAKALQKTLIR